MRAAGEGRVEMVQLLLDAGANKAQGWMEPSLQKQQIYLTRGGTRIRVGFTVPIVLFF